MNNGISSSSSRFTITKPFQKSQDSGTKEDVKLELLENQNTGSLDQIDLGFDKNASPTGDDQHVLALYSEDIHLKGGRFQSFLQNVTAYTATIPPANDSEAQPKQEVAKLGTLVGVYLPCIQNILGVILFIRLSWIVGTAGVLQSFSIVLICCCCTMLTAISMSAIATNGVVPAGGSYFMISRSLGPEFGGAVGVLFYLGTSFASAMYILGAVEILLTYIAPDISLFGNVQSSDGTISTAMLNNMRVYGTFLVILLGSLVFVGVKYVNKCASIFLACVLLSILAIFIGFFVAHTQDVPNICFVGYHLVSSSTYDSCLKNDTKLRNTYLTGGHASSVFFNTSTVTLASSIPGLTGNVFQDNIGSFYKKSGQVEEGVTGIQGEIISDMTTSFTVLLAIFFPSVTGIMAGSNRSGNLKNAQYSIPRGTIAAILTTSSIYLLAVLFFGATVNGDLLRDKFGDSIGGSLLASSVAWPNKWIILIGSLLSTIGAGLQSLTGAPRLLQAIANDGVVPFLQFFSVVSKDGEPKRALFLTLLISEIGVLIASLDAVAPIITMFFLMCYGFVNFACTLQSLLNLPNWRPRFKFYHWGLSLLGMFLCLALMFISSWYYALVAIFIAGFLYKYIEYRGAEKEWGDGLSGLSLSAARFGLLRMEGSSQTHTKNWRPQLLVLIDPPAGGVVLNQKSKKLITLASQMKAGRGLTIVGAVIEGDYLKTSVEVDEYEEEIAAVMKKEKVKGFSSCVASSKSIDGLSYLIQSAGLGALKPNTVILSWPHDWKNTSNWRSFIHSVRVVSEMRRAVIVAKEPEKFPDLTSRESGYLDIWWIVQDGGLMLLMTFLLKQHKVWKKCNLRLFTVAQITDNSIQIKNDLVQLMYNLRLTAEVHVIEMQDSDISAYTYERTLQAEQRKEMLSKMKLSKKQSSKEAQMIFDKGHRSRSGSINGISSVASTGADASGGGVVENRLATQSSVEESDGELGESAGSVQLMRLKSRPDEGNVRRMDTAVKINRLVQEKSSGSRLIMINLPKPPTIDEREFIYMEFIEALIEGLDQVFLVRGGGHEVVTIYS